MKKILILITVLCSAYLSTFAQYHSGTSIDIKSAVDEKIIICEIKGMVDNNSDQNFRDADGEYFGKCMYVKLINQKDSNVNISIPNGLMLMSDDTTVQDMIVTKPMDIYIPARKFKIVQAYAMCTEMHNAMPTRQVNFKIGKMAGKNLLSISNEINEMSQHNISGQGAVWAYTDHARKEDLQNYGATPPTLEITAEILKRAGVMTRINIPDKVENLTRRETIIKHDTIISHITPEKPSENIVTNSDEFLINKYIVYTGAGTILTLLGAIFYVSIRHKSKNEDQIV